MLATLAVIVLAGCSSSVPTGSSTTASSPPVGAAAAAPPSIDIPAVVRQVEPSVVTVLTDNGVGSGIVYKDDGTIISNAHVVAGARQFTLAFADGQRVAGRVRASDDIADVAVLQAARRQLTAASFQQALPQVGEAVVAIGSPLGFEATVTSGIVSGLHRRIPGTPLTDLVQTDAAISPGNSGGALLNAQGQVVGMNVAYIPPAAGAVALGFAIPAATVVDVADQLLATGRAQHAFIGIQPGTLTPQVARQLRVNRSAGVVVLAVVNPSPAADAGIQPGDIIVTVNGRDTPNSDVFSAVIHQTRPGDKVGLTLIRAGATQQASVTVAERPAA
ncbi:MAG: trypsin-like peptidase domain-containing protein [Mycobacterium sp.]|nr:trypsin-like peptidase domain-containing protein [Mycobacterium sp.]